MSTEDDFENDPRLLAQLGAAKAELETARSVAETIEQRIATEQANLAAAHARRAELAQLIATGAEPDRIKVLDAHEGVQGAEANLQLMLAAREPAARRVREAENRLGEARRAVGRARVARCDAALKEAEEALAVAMRRHGEARMARDNAAARL